MPEHRLIPQLNMSLCNHLRTATEINVASFSRSIWVNAVGSRENINRIEREERIAMFIKH